VKRTFTFELSNMLGTLAVGIPIALYPPHKTVRALLRIRHPPRMRRVKTSHRIEIQNGGIHRVEKRVEPLPTHIAVLTATAPATWGPNQVAVFGIGGRNRGSKCESAPSAVPTTIGVSNSTLN
jgi:hypothetical protein